MNEPRLTQKRDELQEQWDLLTQKLAKLEHRKIHENRVDEEFRLDELIEELKTERQKVEQQLQEIEAQLAFPPRPPSKGEGRGEGGQPQIFLNLPVSNPELFGRERELALLDRAWDNLQAKIVVFVAWGGVGKTALLNHWLLRMQQDNWRGAARIFGWTFYSRGTTEHAQASADQFIATALEWCGDPDPNAGAPADKGKRLAGLFQRQRTLLVLDGLEPLQYPPGPVEGKLKDQALYHLLRDLAIHNPGLCLISTRTPLTDLTTFRQTTVSEIALEHLSPEAGAALLRSLGVQGAANELQQAVADFGGHALALNLLGAYLHAMYRGDVRQRDKIRQVIFDDEEDPRSNHARRMLASYESWLAETPKGQRELNILRLLGLFDRPAEFDALAAVLAEPAIPGLTDDLLDGLHLAGGVHLTESPKWQLAVQSLRELRLLAERPTPNPNAMKAGNDPVRAELVEARTAPFDKLRANGNSALNSPASPKGRGISPSPFGEGAGGEVKGDSPSPNLGEGAGGEVLDCHPLVREHFGERPDAWREAHRRLYEYYKNLPEKEYPDTLAEMEPLFAAVAHGCRAGLHQEVYDKVFYERIRRKNEYYILHKLGAFGSFLATLANFFEIPWSQVISELADATKAVVLSQAGFGLRALGRLREAAQPMQAGMEASIAEEDWEGAAQDAGNLSELCLTLGDVPQAVAYARQSVEFADRSGDGFQRESKRTTLADALHQAGETHPYPSQEGMAEAERLFREAEAMQQERQPTYSYLYSLQGFQFCDLLLSQRQFQEVLTRAGQTLEWAKQGGLSLLTIALDNLSLGRALLLQAQATPHPDHLPEGARESLPSPTRRGAGGEVARQYLDQAVAGLRESGNQDDLPRGLLARAAYFRAIGDFVRARADLHEARDIAEQGEMRLFLADYHLETARLINAELRMKDEELKEKHSLQQAKEHLAAAAALIVQTGYHRRDREAAELQQQLNAED